MSVSNLNKRIVQRRIVPLIFSSFLLFSCNGVHNEPPEEVIRTSGAGTSSGAGETRSVTGLVGDPEITSEEAGQTSNEMQRQNFILDSTGNPISLDK